MTSCLHVLHPAPCPDDVDERLTVSASHPSPGVVVLRTVGDVDLATAPAWGRELSDACRRITLTPLPRDVGWRAPAPRLVCDLTGVSFLGAAGLAVLVELADQARHLGVALRLVVDSHVAGRALELTGLDRVLVVVRTVFEALAADR